MVKTGVIVRKNKDRIYILTSRGEFIRLKDTSIKADIGEIVTGKVYSRIPLYCNVLITIGMIFFIFFSIKNYFYNKVQSSVIVDSNVSVSFSVNKYDMIVSANASDLSALKIIDSENIDGRKIDEGLECVTDEMIKKGLISKSYLKNGKNYITVIISSKGNYKVNISSFIKHLENTGFNVQVNDNGN